jgi:hypothetical protein
MAALEVEVRAEADAQRARKEVALQKLRAQAAENEALKARQTELLAKSARPKREVVEAEDDDVSGVGGALELAGKANRVKQELQKTPAKGDKSWVKSGLASLLLGPLGWLYAGSWREAIPASAGWVLLAGIASKIIPMFLLMPVMMVVLPLSGIAGVVYALQYNRHGGRQRLFDKDKDKKQLKSG